MFGSKFGVRLMGLDTWITQLFCGISCALLFNAVLNIVKFTILSYLKHLQIASMCVPDKNPNMVVLSRFKTVGTIVILNKILRMVASELIEAIKNGTASEIPLISQLGNNVIVQKGAFIVKKCFDYVDECILAYCYVHSDEPLGKAAEKAVVIFLENTGSFLIKTTTVYLSTFFIKLIVAILEFVFLIQILPFTFLNLIFVYLVIHVTGFILADSIIEPLMLNGLIKEFCKLDLKDEENIGIFENISAAASKFKNLGV